MNWTCKACKKGERTGHDFGMGCRFGPKGHQPMVTRAGSRFCGTCGSHVMFDPDTLRPMHVPEVR